MPKIVVNERILIPMAVAGLLLSIVAVFLPWGQPEEIPRVYAMLRILLGFELFTGIFALVGCVVNGASLFFFRIGHKMLWCAVMLLGGLVTLVCSLTWILIPGILASGGGLTYRVFFGAYICFTGSILTSTTAILYALYH